MKIKHMTPKEPYVDFWKAKYLFPKKEKTVATIVLIAFAFKELIPRFSAKT
jgi:hypothetical protein